MNSRMTELEERLASLRIAHDKLEKRLSYFFGGDWDNPTSKEIVSQLETNEAEQKVILIELDELQETTEKVTK
jgi:hypothetical protein